MKEDLQASDEQITTFADQVKVLLPATLPSLGVKVAPPSEVATNGDAVEASVAKATKVEDGRLWRASMVMSKGAVPVKPLSAFEDREAKL